MNPPRPVYVQAKQTHPVASNTTLDPIESIKKVKAILPQLKEALVVSQILVYKRIMLTWYFTF